MLSVTAELVSGIGDESDLSCSLDSCCKRSLVISAAACYSSGKDLSALGDILSQASDVLVIDLVDMIRAELADLLLSAHSRAKRLGSVSFGSLSIHLS